MIKQINFDMDGTIADLYGVEGWLDMIINADVTPYANALPLLDMVALATILNRLQAQGWKICVISWLSKSGTKEYNQRVAQTKREWLARNLDVDFDEINIVDYGTPKQIIGNGILFDDEIGNRETWGIGAYDVDNILQILKNL